MDTNWATVVRDRINKKLTYYVGHNDDTDGMPNVPGDVLRVYLGTYGGMMSPHPQVVLANRKPPPGPNEETFTLVFKGPREEALEIFWGHVGMLP
jgi:hypothetical protein